jgi:transposase
MISGGKSVAADQWAARPSTKVGVIAAQGPRYACKLADRIEAGEETIPFAVCEALAPLVVQLRNPDEAIARLDRAIAKMAQKDEAARRLMSIPGVCPIIASAMVANVQDASGFASPREFVAFLWLTPKQNSSGGKQRLGRISKMGNRYLRKLLVMGSQFHVVRAAGNSASGWPALAAVPLP